MTHRARTVRLVVAMNLLAIVTLCACAVGVAQSVKPGSAVLLTPLPVLLVALLLLYVFRGVPTLPRPRFFTATLMAVPFILWWQYGLDSEIREATNGGIPVMIIFTFGFYVVSLSTHLILSSPHGARTELSMTCAVMAMGMAGASSTHPGHWTMPVYLMALAVFVPLMVWTMRSHQVEQTQPLGRRWGRWVVPLLLLGVGTVAGRVGLVAAAERGNEALRHITNRLIEQLPPGGFQVQARRIGSIERLWRKGERDEIMLRVFGDRPGTYLRGAVFDVYNPGGQRGRSSSGSWTISSPLRGRIGREIELKPVGEHLGRNVFNLYDRSSDKPLAVIYPEKEVANAYFVPLGTHQVASYAKRSVYWPHLQSMRPEKDSDGGYLYFEPVKSPADPRSKGFDLHIPSAIKAELGAFVRQRIAPRDEVLETRRKIDRVVRYFNQHYRYKIGQTFSEKKDPILEFLQEKDHGHCEYFASAAVLMLREMDVPARYATGFVCREQGAGEGLWLVRRRDAHAWVEAYVAEEDRWVVVEATPPDYGPAPVAQSGTDRFLEWLGAWWRRIGRSLSYGGFTSLLANLWQMVQRLLALAPLWIWGGLIGLGVLWAFRKNLRDLWKPADGEAAARAEPMRRKLRQAERLLGRHGHVLTPSQTVGQWLGKLEQASLPESIRQEALGLLREYQDGRFGPPPGARTSRSEIH